MKPWGSQGKPPAFSGIVSSGEKGRGSAKVLPKYADVEMPLLRELVRRGGAVRPRDLDEEGRTVYESLADQFGLLAADRVETTSGSEGRPSWERMVRWARQKLLDRGLLVGDSRGIWQVSDDGLDFLRSEQEAQAEASGVPLDATFPDEVASATMFPEGALRRVYVNAYERNPAARAACIAHYGPACVVCGFDFALVYGPLAVGFIHVHHLVPLSQAGDQYEVDPVADLRPVCPNCHAIIHLDGECRSIEEARRQVDPRVLAFWASFAEQNAAADRGHMEAFRGS
jgi:5-methylcytosine-specific restriction protein A